MNLNRFKELLESQMGNVKPLLNEQTSNQLKDGHYLGEGTGSVYQLKDMSNSDTGFTVKSTNIIIRGFVENDPVIVVNGVPISKTWGEGGEVTFKNVNWSGTIEPLTPIITPQSLINNSIPKIIIDSKAPLINIENGVSRFVVGNKMYRLDISTLSKLTLSSVNFNTASVEEFLKLFQDKNYQNAYTHMSSNYKPQTQVMNLYQTFIYVGKDGKPLLYEFSK